MSDNPYQSPIEVPVRPQIDWKQLFFRGLWIAGGGFIGIGIVVAAGEPGLDSIGELTAMAALVAVGIVFHIGLLIAIVAGIWWVITMEKRRLQ